MQSDALLINSILGSIDRVVFIDLPIYTTKEYGL